MKKILTASFLLCFYLLGNAQDVHFSQFYNSPLSLNPALTGKLNGVFRFSLTYRNQWFSLIKGTPYATYAGSFDAPLQFRNDAVGLGLLIIHDRAGDGLLNNFMAMASVAYHKSLDKKGRHVISLGVQAGYNQKHLDMTRAVFYTQLDPLNPNYPSGENITEDTKRFFDLNLGLMANSKFSEKASAYLGFSVFHLTQPNESFLQGDDNLPVRYVAHGGAEYLFHKRIALLPSLIYMRQRQADELNLGTACVFKLTETENTLFYLGAFFRMLPSSKANGSNLDDAFVAYTAFEYRNFRLAFSFDATTSDLAATPKAAGAFEVSLMYVHPFPYPQLKQLLFCPRF
ncbi:MAG: hypothetical protein KatS3mg031_0919 [Chitinophagales bacterium]|nr:MAG: hypothetical protein KatS3mg031_0919 [Chitinophagales bacterium]